MHCDYNEKGGEDTLIRFVHKLNIPWEQAHNRTHNEDQNSQSLWGLHTCENNLDNDDNKPFIGHLCVNIKTFRETFRFRACKKDKQQQAHEEREAGQSKGKMEREHLLGKENCPLTSQLLRFWKKKYRAAAHTTAVAMMQKNGMGRTFSELRSCG